MPYRNPPTPSPRDNIDRCIIFTSRLFSFEKSFLTFLRKEMGVRGGWGEGLGGHKFILTRIAHFMNYARYKNCFILINYYFNKHRLRFLRSLFLHLENFPQEFKKLKTEHLEFFIMFGKNYRVSLSLATSWQSDQWPFNNQRFPIPENINTTA